MTTRLQLDVIRLDFQPRENLVEDTVLQYVAKLELGETLPAIRVRFDGAQYFCEDGFQRLEAARRFGLTDIEAEVVPGTLDQMKAELKASLSKDRQ